MVAIDYVCIILCIECIILCVWSNSLPLDQVTCRAVLLFSAVLEKIDSRAATVLEYILVL